MGLSVFVIVLQCLAGAALAALNASAPAISIPPSLVFDGDDGLWSSFAIEVGTPGQTVRLLPGTSVSAGSAIWVVIPIGCTSVNPNLNNCAGARGGTFYHNQSTTWSTEGLTNQANGDGALYDLNTVVESGLGLSGNGSYGFDTVTLGIPGSGLPTLKNQLVVGIWTDDFFLGSLGLSPMPVNLSSLNGYEQSMMGALVNQSLLPSTSWAYTAGAAYKDPPAYGSLTLGGYDTTRLERNNLSFSFADNEYRDLLVSLQSITYNTAGSSPLLASSVNVFIDSMVSEIWLPMDACQAFEQAFNLTWDDQGQVYFISESAHSALQAQNPEFTFTIGQTGGINNGSVEIVLPYAAFDLNLTAPIVGNNTRYFPLKRASSSSDYTLGRTFLQEAYVIADYDRKNFSVSQALFPPSSISQNIEKIYAPGEKEKKSGGGGLSSGAIAGIVVGVVVCVAITMGLLGYIIWLRRKRNSAKQEPKELDAEGAETHEIGRGAPRVELSGQQNADGRHEMDSPAKVHEMLSPVHHELDSPLVHELNSPDVPAFELEGDSSHGSYGFQDRKS